MDQIEWFQVTSKDPCVIDAENSESKAFANHHGLPNPMLSSRSMIAFVLATLSFLGYTAAAEEFSPEKGADQEPPSFDYPVQRNIDGMNLLIHAPQIRAWPEFESFDGLARHRGLFCRRRGAAVCCGQHQGLDGG